MSLTERLARFSKERSLGAMATAISHEVNQPLIAIQNYAQAARRRLQGNMDGKDKLIELIAKIEGQAERASVITQRVRSLVTTNDSRLVRVSLVPLVEEVIGLLASETEACGCRIACSYAHDLPAVLADSLQVQLALVNLLRNGVQSVCSNDRPDKSVAIDARAIEFLDKAAKDKSKPFFINVNFMKVHQPNLPHPDYQHKSASKSKYADSVVELDARIGRIMDKLRALGLDKNTLVFYTTDNGAWQDVYPDAGYTPLRGTKGTVREGGNRVPAIAIMPGSRNHDIVGGLDLMATFAALGGVKLPQKDRDGQPIIFDSIDMAPVLFGTGKSARKAWFYFTENELTPGAARVGNYKAVFNLRGDNGQSTGGLAVDTNLGWKGAEKYVATVPQIFDLWQDPQERYDIFMNNYTERTWTLVTINAEVKNLMKTYLQYPPRELQSEVYTGPITISQYQRFQYIRELLKNEGISLPLPTGN